MDDDPLISGTGTKNALAVTAVGNAWILCKSKSHSGRNYYFNTLTGEAAWNLSEAEVEKAKNFTKHLSKEHVEQCPEPKEPPRDHEVPDPSSLSNIVKPQVYNRQIINNGYPNIQFTIPPFNHNIGTPFGNPTALLQAIPNSGFNPSQWPAPQIYFPAPVTPVIYHPETSAPLSGRLEFKNNEVKNLSHLQSKWDSNSKKSHYNNSYYRPKRFPRKSKKELRNNDLRQKLSIKRRTFEEFSPIYYKDNRGLEENDKHELGNSLCSTEYEDSKHQPRSYDERNRDDCYQSDGDNDWIEENICFKGNRLNLDIKNLKELADPAANPDAWYIAADKTILLGHLHFLNILINSDKKCRLLVPADAMTDLQETLVVSRTMPRLTKRVRRAIEFLSQQLETCAELGKESPETIGNGNACIINCCLNLVHQKFHVVLLSNDIEMKKYKHTTCVPIFTIKELKIFLTTHPIDDDEDDINIRKSLNAFKITIPNDLAEPVQEDLHTETQPVTLTTENEVVQNNKSNKNTEIHNDAILKSTSRSLDAKVETKTTTSHKIEASVRNGNIGTHSEYSDKSNDATPFNTNVSKKREIRLKRNFARKPVVLSVKSDNRAENRYKWRKRRVIPTSKKSLIEINQCTESTNETKIDESDKSSENLTSNDKNLHNLSNDSQRKRIQLNSLDDTIESSETSSSVFDQRNLTEQIIEETSTSGIISNSTSNFESDCGITKRCLEKSNISFRDKQKPLSKNVMFYVSGPIMEEYLKMSLDEWVSRFVQIMEEVLTQVLQLGQQHLLHIMPPPWTVHEATECIKITFKDNSGVIDAANKLSGVLSKISDDNGRVSLNLKPCEFMEFYSYGVYLVEALQCVVKNCEDLQTALDLLSKLLNDIQNPNLDSGHNDTFVDNQNDTSMNMQKSSESSQVQTKVTPRKTSGKQQDTPEESYNIRSTPKIIVQSKTEESSRAETFFTGLNLQKNFSITIDDTNTSSVNIDRCSLQDALYDSKRTSDTQLQSCIKEPMEPKFIRKFTKCSNFEEKLQSQSKEFCPNAREELRYSQYYRNEDDNMEKEYHYEEDYSSQIEIGNSENSNNVNFLQDSNGDLNVVKFKSFVKEISVAFSDVHSFCVNTRQEMVDNQLSQERRIQIYEKAKRTYLCIKSLSKSITSIFHRETYQTAKTTQDLLMETAVTCDLSDNQFSEYRDIIGKCVDHANTLLESVNAILSVLKS